MLRGSDAGLRTAWRRRPRLALRRVDRYLSAKSGDQLSVARGAVAVRSEEHTSELQPLRHLVCRLLLEKKKDPCCQRASSGQVGPQGSRLAKSQVSPPSPHITHTITTAGHGSRPFICTAACQRTCTNLT